MKKILLLLLCSLLITHQPIMAKNHYLPVESSSFQIYSGFSHGKFNIGFKSHIVVSDQLYLNSEISLSHFSIGIQNNQFGYERRILSFKKTSKHINKLYMDIYKQNPLN